MPLPEFERWLQDRADQRPVATSVPMLDGYIAAIVAGPVSIDPLDWICPLLAVDAAFNHGAADSMPPKLWMLDWAPLLDISDVNHGLLLPILLHCRDNRGRPLLGPARKNGATKPFLRNTHADIPAVVEALGQYWMPTRYACAG